MKNEEVNESDGICELQDHCKYQAAIRRNKKNIM